MKKSFRYSEIIERYLSNEMDYEEIENFEHEVATNPLLASELEMSKKIESALNEELIDFRSKLMQVKDKEHNSRRRTIVIRLGSRKIWYAAASILVLASVGTILFFNITSRYSNETLFKKYYSTENMVDVTRSADANIVEAIMKFQQKDYAAAASLFDHLLARENKNYAGWFFYGISCIETKNFVKAEDAFNHIITDDQSLYVEHAEWYLALCYLKSDQTVKAKQQLQKIAGSTDNYHRREARHLLNKLSN